MRLRPLMLLTAMLVCTPALAMAQDFGVMESAETINKNNFKLRGNPMFVFGKDADATTGVAIAAGYGFTPRFDAEGQLAFYDGVTFFGGNAEYWLIKDRRLDFSVAGGLHGSAGDNVRDSIGVDLTFLGSKHIAKKLELYGGLDIAFENPDDAEGFTTVHLIPGVEYKIHEDLDFVSEFGIGLNDSSRHYFAIGLAYYIR